MSQSSHPTSTPTWRDLAILVAMKSAQDYQAKIRPALDAGRDRLAKALIDLGRQLQAKQGR